MCPGCPSPAPCSPGILPSCLKFTWSFPIIPHAHPTPHLALWSHCIPHDIQYTHLYPVLALSLPYNFWAFQIMPHAHLVFPYHTLCSSGISPSYPYHAPMSLYQKLIFIIVQNKRNHFSVLEQYWFPVPTRCVNPGVFLKVNSTLGGRGAPYFAWLHIGPGQARKKIVSVRISHQRKLL